ncbi:shikimate O-hydroxycinnamoyltransferase-like [Olea europaea subsp. europaea]|uniref:Shikimate O-hydroxycinnamoyltransferase-like n=1 Tax=Olea europaea subsp. europaea TaxID=158383 RepID=A0A8S0Q8C7_OLEEU|nr:shikimate O-hydroxycinnamoyltransferase-like [Olea europaea subsp. europaea]
MIKRDFEVKLSKNEVVAPVLSNLDLLLPPVDVSVFFCELVKNEAREPELLYNSWGVDFVKALAIVEIKDLDLYNPDATVEGKLATQPKCGGMVMTCTFSHQMADAYSANMFLVSWAEMALSKPLPQIRSFFGSILFPRRPTIYDVSVDYMYVPISALPQPPEANDQGSDADDDQIAISQIYYIKSDRINDLQLLANVDNGSSSSKPKRTKLEAFSAFLWKMIAIREFNRTDKFCRLRIVVDGRTGLINADESQAKLIEPYFGNVLSIL